MLLSLGIGYLVWTLFRSDKSDSSYEKSSGKKQIPISEIEEETRQILQQALVAIGCQPKINSDGSLSFAYQGEKFYASISGRFSDIWDPNWNTISSNNPNLPQVREAINLTNCQRGPTVVLTRPDENGIIWFHSHHELMLHPASTENAEYIEAALDSFFTAKKQLDKYYKRLSNTRQEEQKNRQPIGFTANQTKSRPSKEPTQNDKGKTKKEEGVLFS